MHATPDPATAPDDARLVATGFHRLLPGTTRVFRGAFSLLHCQVEGDAALYRGVWAVLLFPITHPDQFVSLRYTDADDKEQEIGVIVRLADFSADAQELIRATLVKQYYQQVITGIRGIECRFGLLFFDVETAGGPRAFTMPWRHDRAEDFGSQGKVLLDSLDNRYIIPDLGALPPTDRRKLTGFIYW